VINADAMATAAQIGHRWIRVPICWNMLEPTVTELPGLTQALRQLVGKFDAAIGYVFVAPARSWRFFLKAVLAAAQAVIQVACASHGSDDASLIKAIEVSEPYVPFDSHGDLWFSSWADDDTVFTSWGDGFGPDCNGSGDFSHHGLARVRGHFPDVVPEVVQRFMPLSDDVNNSKPTSLLFLEGRLYVAIHSPLLFPTIGFLAYSDDYGTTFQYSTDSPRTLTDNWRFICLMFVNMGKDYRLNKDGYVYAFGAIGEVNYAGRVFLARMPRDSILDYSSWTYFGGLQEEGTPQWVPDWHDAVVIEGLSESSPVGLEGGLRIATLFSAVYHPGVQRFLALKADFGVGRFYEARAPWGPWREVETWFQGPSSEWYATYMPGIVTKDMEDDSFYFVVSGRVSLEPAPGDPRYRFRVGKIRMILED